ncbi:Uncharacterised protein [uncultured Clostridium sp.]|uniref:hypothetical protein n=1 Tax=uncultured Clostridium sp. TaxID=59620 RepID=UPI000821D5AB|nr:hypothetical protein [uncultured Clostridium sp.]SCK03859.1 Uncharacterised protein [uncultured Clostridium sp.]
MNNNFQNEKSKKDKMKKIYFGVGVVVLMGMCFSLSYLITDWITNPKYDAFIEDRTVYNSTDVLEDTTTIALISGDNIDKEQSLKEFKEENNIQVDVNQQFLIDFLDDSGYKLEALDNNKIVFKKENSENILVANKYYLGEKDGYFAIYKTDENGRAFIEEENDVFRDYKKVNTIPVSAEEEIKSFKHYYDSKEEALERLAGYMN